LVIPKIWEVAVLKDTIWPPCTRKIRATEIAYRISWARKINMPKAARISRESTRICTLTNPYLS
jgi:hypothetical protein